MMIDEALGFLALFTHFSIIAEVTNLCSFYFVGQVERLENLKFNVHS